MVAKAAGEANFEVTLVWRPRRRIGTGSRQPMSAAPGTGPRPGEDPWAAAVHVGEHDDIALGSGFLIDHRRVMTAAHIVCPRWEKDEPLWVALPKSHQLMDRRLAVSEVIAPGPTAKQHVQDVAILVLADSLAGAPPAEPRTDAASARPPSRSSRRATSSSTSRTSRAPPPPPERSRRRGPQRPS
jgi:hypothetical protein